MSALQITPLTLTIRPGRSYPFGGLGGTAPYTWAVSTNNSGGSISSSGVYTSGPNNGVDTITVTDSVAATATATVNVNTVVQLVGDIIANFLGLGADQYWLWDQKIDIPNDSRPYLILSVVSEKAFGQSNYHDGGSSGEDPLVSVQSVNIAARIGIDFLSRGPAARDTKDKILLALNSDYSESQQELNQFYLARIPINFINLSQVDGAAIPYRFHLEVNVQYAITHETLVPYFDNNFMPQVSQKEN